MNPDMVTHPSTNWARHRLTSLMKTNVLLLHQTTTNTSLSRQKTAVHSQTPNKQERIQSEKLNTKMALFFKKYDDSNIKFLT